MGTYNIPSQQSLSITAIAPLLNSQKIMEKYFVHILPAQTFQRLNFKENRKIQPLSDACAWDRSPHFSIKSMHLPQLLLFRANSVEVPTPDAGILWKQALVALPFSLQLVFALRLYNF